MSKEEALKIIWNENGSCCSCGWHALIREHDLTEEELIELLEKSTEKYVKLDCANSDYPDEVYAHRGIYLPVKEFKDLLLVVK